MENYIKKARIEDKPTIHDFIQPYLNELSSFPDDSPDYKDKNGIYRYPYLDNYWQEDTRYPYLFFRGNKVTGFALVSYYGGYWRMSEIYVIPEFRKLKVAFDCVTEIFKEHPGKWEIQFNKDNTHSRSLWEKLADKFSTGFVSHGSLDRNHDYIRFSV